MPCSPPRGRRRARGDVLLPARAPTPPELRMRLGLEVGAAPARHRGTSRLRRVHPRRALLHRCRSATDLRPLCAIRHPLLSESSDRRVAAFAPGSTGGRHTAGLPRVGPRPCRTTSRGCTVSWCELSLDQRNLDQTEPCSKVCRRALRVHHGPSPRSAGVSRETDRRCLCPSLSTTPGDVLRPVLTGMSPRRLALSAPLDCRVPASEPSRALMHAGPRRPDNHALHRRTAARSPCCST